MRARARSNTALFRTGRWRRSGLTNLPRLGARGAMVFSCAAALPAAAKCCAIGALAAGAGSGCSRGRQALRAGCGAPAEAKGRLRTVAATRRAEQPGRLHHVRGATRQRSGAARCADLAQTRGTRRRAKSHQALHPRGFPAGAGAAWPYRCPGASALRCKAFGADDRPPARDFWQARAMTLRALCFLLVAYRWCVRPLLPSACRFYPSCSHYAEEALLRHGFWRGGWLAARRVCRCGPWHPGGHDPVP
jgi:putative membrane protein insertion efficiency factor